MGADAKYFSMSYDSAEVIISNTPKTDFLSLRLIKDSGALNPGKPSYVTNVLLCGNCIDAENRKLYVFYIDTFYGASWIIEFGIDDRVINIVDYDENNRFGFDPLYKIRNPRIVNGRIIWTDDKNPIYMIDIERAKKSVYYCIGYTSLATKEWKSTDTYYRTQVVSNGKYFYKALTNNGNIKPGSDDTVWEKLCLIEDAYYSRAVVNYYFAALPPKTPPVIEYFMDDMRKINSLKHTLFQFAYRYIYMDWRKSTFSPASIVPLPQAEEEVATGLANEEISINNALKVTVNLGGEEVRAIEIIARSSEDPSKWFLVETVEKFTDEERESEVSGVNTLQKAEITIVVPIPTVTCVGITDAGAPVSMTLSVPNPTMWISHIDPSVDSMSFLGEESGDGDAQTSTIDIEPGAGGSVTGVLESFPSWITIKIGGVAQIVGNIINDGDILSISPTIDNPGSSRNGFIIIRDDLGDLNYCQIFVEQAAQIGVPTIDVYMHPEADPALMSISGESGVVTAGSPYIQINVTPDFTGYGYLVDVGTNYIIWKNGANVGSGIVTLRNLEANTKDLTMSSDADPGQAVQVWLWIGELIP